MILGPPAMAFTEIDEAVAQLQAARGDERPVVLFWQYDVAAIPKGAVVYNFDLPIVHFSTDAMRVAAARASEVWEFSERGLDAWRRIGVTAKHVPVGYHPSMTRFERREPDIDVVFSGSLNSRRWAVFQELKRAGFSVALAPADRAVRDALLARARASINMLFYPSGVYPVLRAAHLLANDVPYVGERCHGSEWDPTSGNFVDYDRLVDATIARVEIGNGEGHKETFMSRPMVLPT